ncbi:MAG: hypothetical protein ACRD4O_02875, partial [Bryobacteraceae bacterium]
VHQAFERLAVEAVQKDAFGGAVSQGRGRNSLLFQTISRILYHWQNDGDYAFRAKNAVVPPLLPNRKRLIGKYCRLLPAGSEAA